MTEPTPTPPSEAANGRHSAPQAPDGAEAHRDRNRGVEAGTGALDRYRAWLANEHAKAVRADRETNCPAELKIPPHNGIAAGLATALHGLDTILGRGHDDGPSVREAAADDRRWFDSEKAGE